MSHDLKYLLDNRTHAIGSDVYAVMEQAADRLEAQAAELEQARDQARKHREDYEHVKALNIKWFYELEQARRLLERAEAVLLKHRKVDIYGHVWTENGNVCDEIRAFLKASPFSPSNQPCAPATPTIP